MNTDTSTDGRLSESELCPDDLLPEQEAAFERDIARLHKRRDEFVEVGCPACCSEESDHVYDKFGFDYRICSDCETIYMSPRPSEAVMADYYRNSENYQYWAKYIFPASEATRREKINRPWLERIVEICSRYGVPRKHMVEIGPGFGTFSALVNELKGFEKVTAVEPTPEMARACRERGVDVIEKGVEEVGDEIEKAQVVTAFEVIEHLFLPEEFFAKAKAILDPGGLLIVSCPNSGGFDLKTLKAESLAVDAEHVNLFNPRSLRRLGERVGFDCLEVTTPGKLDAEFVRTAILEGRYSVDDQPFLKEVLIDRWDELGWPFQQFLSGNGMSSHMWAVFRLP